MPNRPTSLIIPGDRLLMAANFLTYARRAVSGDSGWNTTLTGYVTGERLALLTQRTFPLKEALTVWGGWSTLIRTLRATPDLPDIDVDIVPALNLEPDAVKNGFLPFLAAVASEEVGLDDLTEAQIDFETEATQAA